jgi:D-methionine transport system substrate-binding protein
MQKRHLLQSLAAAAILTTCAWQAHAQTTLRIGFFPGPYADQFKRGIQPSLEKAGLKVQVTEFSNAIQPNTALMDGSLDANVFQNLAWMNVFNEKNKGDLVEVLRVPSAPLGLYSTRHASLAALPEGARVALPNDPTSMNRSLMFLQEQGLIKLDPAAPAGRTTEKHVTANPKKLQLVLLDAPQIPRAMAEMDLSVALGNHIIASGKFLTDALVLEDPAPQYQIILVARKTAVDSAPVKQLAAAYKSAEYRRFVESDPKAKGFSRPDHWR